MTIRFKKKNAVQCIRSYCLYLGCLVSEKLWVWGGQWYTKQIFDLKDT